MTSQKYYFYQRPIREPSETHQRPTCLIGDQLETDMPDQRPTYLIRDPLEIDMPHRRPTCLIRDPSETNMPDGRPIGDRHVSSEIHWRPTCLIEDPTVTDMPHRRPSLGKICISYGSPMRHVVLPWSPIRQMGLQ